MAMRRLVAGGLGAVALTAAAGIVTAAPAGADAARCMDHLHDAGFVPGAVHPSSYAIAEDGCEAGERGAMIICTSLINLATEELQETHPGAIDPYFACLLASWLS